MNRFSSSAAVGLFALAGIGAAQAQTTDLFNENITISTPAGALADGGGGLIASSYIDYAPITFTVPVGESLYIEGLASVNAAIGGTADLTGPSYNSGLFVLDPNKTGDTFNTATLAPGQYTLNYSLDDSNSSLPDVVNIEGTVSAAPEIDPASAASGLTLLAGALLVLRGRRRTTAVTSFA